MRLRLRQGLTLIELLVTVAMTALLTVAVAFAFDQTIRLQREGPERIRATAAESYPLERLNRLLQGAFLPEDASDPRGYFIFDDGLVTGLTGQSLVWVTYAESVNLAYLGAEGTLEELNERFGPQGGHTEVMVSTSPIGQPEQEVAGLFLRLQKPADGDATQGGFEELLIDGAEEVLFEFYDGVEWVDAWDTRTGERRLPAAVRIQWTLRGEPRSLMVRLPLSDVTPENPANATATGQAPAGGTP